MKIPTRNKRNVLLTLIALAIIVAALSWLAIRPYQTKNYAKEVASPLEKSLLSAGAVKQCSNGDAGRGSDNRMPWYYAVYEMSGEMNQATTSLKSIAKANGFTLTDGSTGVNVEDNLLLIDENSKKSDSTDLVPGNIKLLTDVYASKVYNGEAGYLCGVITTDNPPKDRTTIRFTINLPEFKR